MPTPRKRCTTNRSLACSTQPVPHSLACSRGQFRLRPTITSLPSDIAVVAAAAISHSAAAILACSATAAAANLDAVANAAISATGQWEEQKSKQYSMPLRRKFAALKEVAPTRLLSAKQAHQLATDAAVACLQYSGAHSMLVISLHFCQDVLMQVRLHLH